MSIFDFHADLLCYLAEDIKNLNCTLPSAAIFDLAHSKNSFKNPLELIRTPYDTISRASIMQMQKGGVKGQVLPIFVDGEEKGLLYGMAQFNVFFSLLERLKYEITYGFQNFLKKHEISIRYAVENAMAFSDPLEPIEKSLERLEKMCALSSPLYISFTWNGENRFGGGAHTEVGLKEDGKRLLEWLSHKKIAFDFSHTSDALAYDVLSYIESKKLDIPVLASHSNFREVFEAKRNLPLEIAQEIVKRKGVIGINFVRYFIGNKDPLFFIKQIEYALNQGFLDHLVLGADFFYEGDVPRTFRKAPGEVYFPHFENASCYPHFIQFLKKEGISQEIIEKIAHKNALNFLLQCSL